MSTQTLAAAPNRQSLVCGDVYTLAPRVGDRLATARRRGAPRRKVKEPVPNERKTEALVRRHFASDRRAELIFEEQMSDDARVLRALSSASKSGTGPGRPEFIIRHPDCPNLLVIVECKAKREYHESVTRDRWATYAVDGVLHYSEHLSRYFDVVSVAVSGDTQESLKISTFRQLRGAQTAESLLSGATPLTDLVSFDEYRRLLLFDPLVRKRTLNELMAYSRELHVFMRDYAKVSEAEKPLLVSGILLALRDDAFRRTYASYRPIDLAVQLYSAIERMLSSDLAGARLSITLQPYYFIKTHPELVRTVSIKRVGRLVPLEHLVAEIDENVRPFVDTYDDVDIIGQFYGEFLRYSGGDKKSLGIVLTPRHITDLAAALVDVKPTDTVVDTCAGSGGFLISAMARMDVRVPNHDTETRKKIREQQLIGIEQQPSMFALAISNMMLRGDGKSNLYRGSCFDEEIRGQIRRGVPGRHARPTVGLINPPFSQKGEGLQELYFVQALLDLLVVGGRAFCILPMSCVISRSTVRSDLLKEHTLDAVVSLPDELFYPVGTITCATLWRAHEPHEHAVRPTWFGYWKNDGFVKAKDRGRVDDKSRWENIRHQWVDHYFGRVVAAGRSASWVVGPDDEWCAEAYMRPITPPLTRQLTPRLQPDMRYFAPRG